MVLLGKTDESLDQGALKALSWSAFRLDIRLKSQ